MARTGRKREQRSADQAGAFGKMQAARQVRAPDPTLALTRILCAQANWTTTLKPHVGKEVRCQELTGALVWNDEKCVTDVQYVLVGREEIGSVAAFEKAAGCARKRPKETVTLVESGLSLGRVAEATAARAGPPHVEP